MEGLAITLVTPMPGSVRYGFVQCEYKATTKILIILAQLTSMFQDISGVRKKQSKNRGNDKFNLKKEEKKNASYLCS